MSKALATEPKPQSSLVPRLRFPQFQDAGEWEEAQLSDFVHSLDAGVSVNAGDRPASANEPGILKTSALSDGLFLPEQNKVVSAKGEQSRLRESVLGGTIIISRMNTPALVGANAYVQMSHGNLFLPDRLWAAKPKEGVSMRFLAQVIGSPSGRMVLSKLAKGSSGSMKNISKPEVLAVRIVAPTLPEQQRIASCLSSLDTLITAHTQKLSALKTYKKGLMQQLFPREGETVPRLRFPEFMDKGPWSIDSLGSLFDTSSGGTPDRTKEEYWNGRIPWITTSLVNFNIITEAEEFITDIGLNNSSAKVFPAETILMAMYGQGKTRGKVAMLATKAATNQACAAILPRTDIDPRFVFLNLSSRYEEMRNLSNSGGQENLSQGLIQGVQFSYPNDQAEQQRIASCLATFDDLINAQSQKIEALKTHKKGLMQGLFPNVIGP